LKYTPTLRPLTIHYPTDNIPTKNSFDFYHSLHEHGKSDVMVYPKGFRLDDESIRVWIIFHDPMGEEETTILCTSIDPKTEKIIRNDEDESIRVYSNRRDAYNYVERLSKVILNPVL
jgi:hypothetical protein